MALDPASWNLNRYHQRFGDRDGLLRALALHIAQDEARVLSRWTTVEQIFEHYPQYAMEAPHRYKLLADTFLERVGTEDAAPAFHLLTEMLANRIGGTPADQRDLALGLTALMAGTVAGIVTAGENTQKREWVRRAVKSVLRRVLANSDRAAQQVQRRTRRKH